MTFRRLTVKLSGQVLVTVRDNHGHRLKADRCLEQAYSALRSLIGIHVVNGFYPWLLLSETAHHLIHQQIHHPIVAMVFMA